MQQPESSATMEKLFYAILHAWCWLRVAAFGLVVGAALGGGAYYFIQGTLGLVSFGLLALVGLYLGVRLANHARRKGQLVELAEGLPPSKGDGSP